MPAIRACPYIRQLEDVIDRKGNEHCFPSNPNIKMRLVLEWMDTDLWQLRPYGKLTNPRLPQVVAKSVLEALVVFQRLHAVHTGKFYRLAFIIIPLTTVRDGSDVNPNNIFVSNLDQSTPTVKLGDLDNGESMAYYYRCGGLLLS